MDILCDRIFLCAVIVPFWEHTIHEAAINGALQMFTGNYRDFAGKSECRDFNFMGIACIPAIPVIFKTPHSDFHYNICRELILQGYYGESLH